MQGPVMRLDGGGDAADEGGRTPAAPMSLSQRVIARVRAEGGQVSNCLNPTLNPPLTPTHPPALSLAHSPQPIPSLPPSLIASRSSFLSLILSASLTSPHLFPLPPLFPSAQVDQLTENRLIRFSVLAGRRPGDPEGGPARPGPATSLDARRRARGGRCALARSRDFA
jgi:hypothetical protein